ncbi:MAG: hypothetical protein U0325_29045 [Polyangiales bacterium]
MPSRPWLPLCALLALGCASNPPPTDAGTDTPAPLDGGTDVAPPEDRPAALDVVAVDMPDVNQTEIAPMVDAPDVVDAGGGEDAPDAVAVVDAPAMDAPDVVTADTPDVAVAVVDVVQLADVVDAAADAPRDTGPADAGPVLYDLNQARGALEVRAAFKRTLPDGTVTVCDGAVDMTGCEVSGGALRFSLRSCSLTFTALLPLGSSTGRVVTVTGGAGGSPVDVSPVVVSGSPGLRQSFRVGVTTTRTTNTVGVEGLPGRTVDAARADLWLLGCEVR